MHISHPNICTIRSRVPGFVTVSRSRNEIVERTELAIRAGAFHARENWYQRRAG